MKWVVINLLQLLIKISRRWLRLISTLHDKIDTSFDLNAHNKSVLRSTVVHDMKNDTDELYYTEQYWIHINNNLDCLEVNRVGRFLDLGCGQGRLTLPLAKWSKVADITGVDLSEVAIAQAKENSKGMNNINFIQSDISEYLREIPDASIDVIFFFEVSFFLPDLDQVLMNIKRVLKPGGILFSSFRSRYFNTLCCIQDGLWSSSEMLLDKRSGKLFGSETFLNWNTSEELRNIFIRSKEFKLHDFRGIGCCSGIAGDPHSKFARPSLLNDYEKTQLMKLENATGLDVPDAGRYIFMVAEKSGEIFR